MRFHHGSFIILIAVVILLKGHVANLYAVPYYEKSDVREKMEKREVVSVVKVENHPTLKEIKILNMTAAGIVRGASIPTVMRLMSDYNRLKQVAPDYITESDVFEYKGEKILHLKAEVSALLAAIKFEVYSKVREEETPEKGIIHWQIVNGSSVGRQDTDSRWTGVNGQVIIEPYRQSKSSGKHIASQQRGSYRVRRKDNKQLRFLFMGKIERENMDRMVPNIMTQILMEVGLQRVGVLMRNYFETYKELNGVSP